MNRAIFLDRDGTLNYDSRDYIKNLKEFKLFPYTIPALRIFKKLGYKLVIITNQACIGRGLTTKEAVEEIHNYLIKVLKQEGINLDGIYYCPHRKEDGCICRKPAIGNVLKAAEELEIDLKRSFFIGDSYKDVATGKRAGCRTIKVGTGVWGNDNGDLPEEEVTPDYYVNDILAAAELVDSLESWNI